MSKNDSPHVFLSGENVSLCPVRMEDVPIYARWINHPDIREYLVVYFPITLEAEREVLTEMLSEKPIDAIHLAIWSNDPQELLGNVSLMRIDHREQKAHLGIFIGEERSRNRGLGTEAIGLIMDYGFSTLNLRKIMLMVYASNKRAQKAYAKLGFVPVGRWRENRRIGAEWVDEIMMEVFENEFYEAWKKS